MTDVHDQKTRSYNMSMIKGKNTKPEIIVRKYLHKEGYRYRLNHKNLPGKPDIVLPKYKTVIFIHGCFWHGHDGCKFSVIPKTRIDWWKNKINKNKLNDSRNISLLIKSDWKVIVIYECQLKMGNRQAALNELVLSLKINNL